MPKYHQEIEINPYHIKKEIHTANKLYALNRVIKEWLDHKLSGSFELAGLSVNFKQDSNTNAKNAKELKMTKKFKNVLLWIYHMLIFGLVVGIILIFKLNYDELGRLDFP